ncbi:hypothetical protein PICSAR10_04626 [Mycobacterium avium subsp. paratuberculosis]|nr:hypothetical protein PICSAR10_04626 [Mycobacterium avium subsp. paratuberculosis]
MTTHGYTHAYPHRGNEPMTEKPSWDINAGYVLRSVHALPKSPRKPCEGTPVTTTSAVLAASQKSVVARSVSLSTTSLPR